MTPSPEARPLAWYDELIADCAAKVLREENLTQPARSRAGSLKAQQGKIRSAKPDSHFT